VTRTIEGVGAFLRDARVRRLVFLAVSLAIIALDQATKAVVSARIPLHATINVIPGFFDLTHVKNTGAAFGLFNDAALPGRTALLTLVAAAVFVGVVVYAFRTPAHDTVLQASLAFISGGAVGNLIDRIRFESVTDFLRFYAGSHEWPSFNVADSAITVGVVLLAWDAFRRPDRERASSAGSAEA
jgi:signal peptidase II